MRSQELNMLMVFDAIMTEGSITRAAERLSMTQPAVSNTVSRMRVMWEDELFIRNGRTIQSTLFAKNLWAKVQTPLRDLSAAIDPVGFDPKTSTRTFRIGAANLAIDLIWQKLRHVLDEQAPNVNIYAYPYTVTNGVKMLEDAEVDLAIGITDGMPENVKSQFILQSCYCCVMRKGHPLGEKPMTIEEFAEAKHVLVSLSGDPLGETDTELAKYNLTRRVAMTVNHFSAVSPIVSNSDLISVIPTAAVMHQVLSGELIMRKPPVDLPESIISALWHKRQETDAGLIWLRQLVVEVFQQYVEEHNALLCKHMTC